MSISSVGSFTRFVPEQVDPFNERVKAFLTDDASQLDDSDKLTAEQIKAAALLAEREDQAKQDRLASQQEADAFVAGHPEYDDKSEANAHLLLNQVETMFGKGLHTVKQYEQAYQYLRENTNFLKLDAKELAKQKKSADKARFDAAHNPVTPSEQDLHDMPLEDLRRLDAVENQKRMQRRGEEGGW